MAVMESAWSGFMVGHELGELVLEQLVPGLELGDEVEDLLQDLAQGQATVHVHRSCAAFRQRVVLLGLVENLAVYVVDGPVPLSGLDGLLATVSSSRTVSANRSNSIRSIFIPSVADVLSSLDGR